MGCIHGDDCLRCFFIDQPATEELVPATARKLTASEESEVVLNKDKSHPLVEGKDPCLFCYHHRVGTKIRALASILRTALRPMPDPVRKIKRSWF